MRRAGYFLLLGLGLLQILGYVLGVRALRGVGAASAASPLPIVFSDVAGLETFASEFRIFAKFSTGEQREFPITPQLYSRFEGPYNRRNVYGAAIAYGPRLPEKVWQSVLKYGFCRPAPLARALGMEGSLADLTVRLATKTRGRSDVWNLGVACDR